MRSAKQGNRRVYDRGHSIPRDLSNNPMLKRLIIPEVSETHLPAIAHDAMQQTRPQSEADEERDQ
jgi:hypothetical protein